MYLKNIHFKISTNLQGFSKTADLPARSAAPRLCILLFFNTYSIKAMVQVVHSAPVSILRPTLLQMEPKRLKKDLAKVLKSMRPEDRVLVVGTSRRPFDADPKPFCKLYRKILLIPRPDYASRLGRDC